MYLYKILAGFVVISIIAATPSKTYDASSRIIGGKNAVVGQFPYQVSIQYGKNVHICSGAIINNEWIVTAANCVYEAWQVLQAVAGTTTYKNGGARYKVLKKYVHPKFSASNLTNDIALLQLESTIVFNNSTKSVNLPLPTTTSSGLNMTTTGWGATKAGSSFSNRLLYANVTTITIPQCQQTISKTHVVGNTNVCTLGREKFGSCKGDVGNPLVHNYVLHGVLSYFVDCKKPDPDVYSSVAAYRMWINSVAGI